MGIIFMFVVGWAIVLALGVMTVVDFSKGNVARGFFWIAMLLAAFLSGVAYSLGTEGVPLLGGLGFGLLTLLLNPVALLSAWIPLESLAAFDKPVLFLVLGTIVFFYWFTRPKRTA